ncbi:MAG: helix-turn-helix domain-containing protein [Treponemataceae bacterium]
MQSFGETLREARESRGIDLDRAARETNISKKYLKSLEEELLTMFPGEAYLAGFLRNYADYLDLDPESIVNLYKAAKIQESPVPEALLKKTRKKLTPLAIIVLAAFFSILFITIATITYVNYAQSKKQVFVPLTRTEVETYHLTNSPIQKRLYRGDKIILPFEDGEITLTVGETLRTLSLLAPSGVQVIELGEEVDLDIDGNTGGEVTIFLSDISSVDEGRGAEVQMMLSQGYAYVNENPVAETPIEVETNNKSIRRSVIFEGGTAYPVTVNVTFRGSCLFRYEADRKERVERFYANNETLSIQANNGIRIWSSNANSTKLQIMGGGRTVELEAGRQGHVVVQDIKWIKDEDGKFRLVVLAVE